MGNTQKTFYPPPEKGEAMYGSRSGISPVMATVILVAIAIVIAIAVAFWATGLVGVFTRFEKLEITSVYAEPTGTANQYDITIRAKNTGSSPATLDQVLLNGVPICELSNQNWTSTNSAPTGFTINSCGNPTKTALNPGDMTEVTIRVTAPSAGVTVEVALHTASGKQYPYSVLLP